MSTAATELYSLLVPLHDARLIVPRACVAEVVSYSQVRPLTDAPSWLAGSMNWNGRQLPLVSFEAAAGLPVPEQAGRTRVVVFHALGGALQPPFFGVLTQGFPQLVRVNAEVLQADGSEYPPDGPILCRVRMINEYPLIPDLHCLERMLHGALREDLPR